MSYRRDGLRIWGHTYTNLKPHVRTSTSSKRKGEPRGVRAPSPFSFQNVSLLSCWVSHCDVGCFRARSETLAASEDADENAAPRVRCTWQRYNRMSKSAHFAVALLLDITSEYKGCPYYKRERTDDLEKLPGLWLSSETNVK